MIYIYICIHDIYTYIYIYIYIYTFNYIYIYIYVYIYICIWGYSYVYIICIYIFTLPPPRGAPEFRGDFSKLILLLRLPFRITIQVSCLLRICVTARFTLWNEYKTDIWEIPPEFRGELEIKGKGMMNTYWVQVDIYIYINASIYMYILTYLYVYIYICTYNDLEITGNGLMDIYCSLIYSFCSLLYIDIFTGI